MRMVVVRHGEAEPKKGWTGPDDQRPLVARGQRQADRLGKVIGGLPPTRIISSPAVRCVQTVQPLADRYGLPVEVDESLSTEAGKAAADLCRQLASSDGSAARDGQEDNIVLCTHREVLVDLLPRLSEQAKVKLRGRPPGAKGGAWVIRWDSGHLQKIDYRPPGA
ncbi:MAG TPA: phosphoglycerate mutase family protein [Acidimicrobiales bacterium]|nr:phosphoglycerate mutase family protein [Acidimicrobiales bacterium]